MIHEWTVIIFYFFRFNILKMLKYSSESSNLSYSLTSDILKCPHPVILDLTVSSCCMYTSLFRSHSSWFVLSLVAVLLRYATESCSATETYHFFLSSTSRFYISRSFNHFLLFQNRWTLLERSLRVISKICIFCIWSLRNMGRLVFIVSGGILTTMSIIPWWSTKIWAASISNGKSFLTKAQVSPLSSVASLPFTTIWWQHVLPLIVLLVRRGASLWSAQSVHILHPRWHRYVCTIVCFWICITRARCWGFSFPFISERRNTLLVCYHRRAWTYLKTVVPCMNFPEVIVIFRVWALYGVFTWWNSGFVENTRLGMNFKHPIKRKKKLTWLGMHVTIV